MTGRAGGGRPALRALLPAAAALMLAALVPAAACAQGGQPAGVLAGTVTAAPGDSALARATIFVQGTLLRALTDSHGGYRLLVRPGTYSVRATALGYAAAARDGLRVTPGDTVRADFALERQVLTLPGLVVTASREEQQHAESPASIAVIPQADLKNRSVVTLAQALPYAAGATYAGGQFDIRGAAGLSGGVGSRVLLLLDGHPLLTGDTGELDFEALPVLGVQRIEIVKGPYSALYGSNALGGVINIVTSPVPDRPQLAARAYLGAYDIPSEDRFRSGAALTRGLELEQSLPLGALAGRFFLGRVSDDGFTQNGQVSRWLARTELALPGPQGRTSSLYAIWSQEDVGEFFGWRSADHRLEVPTDAVGDWYRMGWLNLGATLNIFARAASSLRLDPYLYYDAVQNHFHDNADYHRANRMGSTAQLTLLPGATQSLTLGGEAASTTVTSNILGKPTQTDFALFAQDEATIRQSLKVSVGARLDRHSVNPGVAEAQFSPKLGLVYRVGPALSLRASASRGFRAPSPVEQFVSTIQYGVHVVPNPDLRAEHVSAGEVGATATPVPRLWLDAAIFLSEYRDLIQPAPVPGQFFVFQFRNVDRARVRGLDLESRLALLPDVLSLDATYMYLDTRDLLTDEALPYRSRHTGTASLELMQGLLALDLQYRSRVDQVLQYPLDPRGSTKLLGARAAYRVGQLLLQLRASNLLQERYVDLQERFPGAPRSVLLMVSHGV